MAERTLLATLYDLRRDGRTLMIYRVKRANDIHLGKMGHSAWHRVPFRLAV